MLRLTTLLILLLTHLSPLQSQEGGDCTLELIEVSISETCVDSCDGVFVGQITGIQGNLFAELVSFQGIFPVVLDEDGFFTFEDLCAMQPGQEHVITINDDICTQFLIFNIPEVECEPLELIVEITSETCPGTCDGQIELNAIGGIEPYTFSILQGGIEVMGSQLCQGIYEVFVIDAEGTIIIEDVEIVPNDLQAEFSTTDATCGGECSGSFVINTQTEVYEVFVKDLMGEFVFASISDGSPFELDSLCAGAYSAQITDANCEQTLFIEILEPPPVEILINAIPASPGECDGEILAVIAVGGDEETLEITPLDPWMFGDTLCSGETICFLAEDANGCSAEECVEIITGITEQEVEISVYPNPSTQEVFVSSSRTIKRVQVFSSDGAVVMNIELNRPVGSIKTDSMSPGMYVLDIEFEDETHVLKRIIRKK